MPIGHQELVTLSDNVHQASVLMVTLIDRCLTNVHVHVINEFVQSVSHDTVGMVRHELGCTDHA
jgi:hypothetical protein